MAHKQKLPQQCIFSLAFCYFLMILIFCKNINYCKIVLLDFPIFNRNMRYPGLKIYALWDVQGYKNIMALLSWNRIFWCFTTYYSISSKTCVKRYTATAKGLWCIQTKSKNSSEKCSHTKFNKIYIYIFHQKIMESNILKSLIWTNTKNMLLVVMARN